MDSATSKMRIFLDGIHAQTSRGRVESAPNSVPTVSRKRIVDFCDLATDSASQTAQQLETKQSCSAQMGATAAAVVGVSLWRHGKLD